MVLCTERSWGLGGFRNQITKWMNPDATTADLGEKMEAYYDKEKKVWIWPGEDPDEKAKPLAPPPTMTTTKEEEKEDVKPLPTDPLSAMMAPPPRAVSSLRRPGGGPRLPSKNTGMFMPPGVASATPIPDSKAPPTFMVFQPKLETNKEKDGEKEEGKND